MFDSYIFVDWGASNTPRPVEEAPDSPFVGELTPAEGLQAEEYHRTRQCATEHVLLRLRHHKRLNRRVLVGFDFPYGYPHGFAHALHLPNRIPAWQAIWNDLSNRIEDDDENANNRFAVASDLNNLISGGTFGPFWGCPNNQVTNHLTTTSVDAVRTRARLNLPQYRLCEGLNGLQETWKLCFPGSVGSQTLMGIPRLHDLRYHPDLVGCSRVWPFETFFGPNPVQLHRPFILHAEIWPGIPDVPARVNAMLQANPRMIKDRAQVRAMCQWAHEEDQNNQLGAFFQRPNNLTDQQAVHCINEEGWILGV